MILDKTQIAELVPHGAGMSLIDRVIECNALRIVCETDSHKAGDNPLINNGKLAGIILVEYASQAAAIHAALNQQKFTQGKPAYIGSIKNVVLESTTVSSICGTLTIVSVCSYSSPSGAIYEFDIGCVKCIAKGQINLILPK